MLLPSVRLAQLGRRRALGGASYSCNITVGNTGVGFYGYDTGALFWGSAGSINAEPIAGQTLAFWVWLADGSFHLAGFVGDIVSLVNGLNLWVNGVNYGGAGSWSFDGTYTYTGVSASGPTFTSGTYLAELK